MKQLENITREQRMRRYDECMNQHGHYSMLKQSSLERSPILDEIAGKGIRLASDYAERHGYPPACKEWIEGKAVDIEPVDTSTVNTVDIDKSTEPVDRKAYQREWLRKRRAANKSG